MAQIIVALAACSMALLLRWGIRRVRDDHIRTLRRRGVDVDVRWPKRRRLGRWRAVIVSHVCVEPFVLLEMRPLSPRRRSDEEWIYGWATVEKLVVLDEWRARQRLIEVETDAERVTLRHGAQRLELATAA